VSSRTLFTLRRFMSLSEHRALSSRRVEFEYALERREWSRAANAISDIASFLRRHRIPSVLRDRFARELIDLAEIRIKDSEAPPSLYDDMRRVVLNEFVTQEPLIEERVKERRKEAEKELLSKIADLTKIETGPEKPVLFFLGAGASKPAPSNIPTINELLEELWKKSNQMENKPLAKLEAWCRENRIDNIEEMLTGVTFADFMIKNRKVHNLLNSVLYPEWGSLKELSIRDVDSVSSFQNMTDTFFSLLAGTMLNAQPNSIHKAIAEFVKSMGNTEIITTNYDVCMDEALDNAGLDYSYVIGSEKNPATSKPLVKMHGSINWFYCQTCQNVLMPTVEDMREAIENKVPYSVTGMCPTCTAPCRQFIVPPTTYKYLIYPPIVQVWNTGREVFELSKIYVIVGYSFSAADDYISKMLLSAVRKDPTKQVIVINQDKGAVERFKTYVTTHAVAFKEKNIHGLVGPAEEIVPKVVSALIKRRIKRKPKKKTE
jgi:NAD-dependent SIR2 family protein deacetylase